jgi:hypothetical protein
VFTNGFSNGDFYDKGFTNLVSSELSLCSVGEVAMKVCLRRKLLVHGTVERVPKGTPSLRAICWTVRRSVRCVGVGRCQRRFDKLNV